MFLYSVLLLFLSVYFPFFSVVGFPFHPQFFFFPMFHLLFFSPFILVILLLIFLCVDKSAF